MADPNKLTVDKNTTQPCTRTSENLQENYKNSTCGTSPNCLGHEPPRKLLQTFSKAHFVVWVSDREKNLDAVTVCEGGILDGSTIHNYLYRVQLEWLAMLRVCVTVYKSVSLAGNDKARPNQSTIEAICCCCSLLLLGTTNLK